MISKKKEVALDEFLSDEDISFDEKVKNQKRKFIKKDRSIIERIDKIIISEDGRQLLREQY